MSTPLSHAEFDRLLVQCQLPPEVDAALRERFASEGPTAAFVRDFRAAIEETIRSTLTATYALGLGDEAQALEQEADATLGKLLADMAAPLPPAPPVAPEEDA